MTDALPLWTKISIGAFFQTLHSKCLVIFDIWRKIIFYADISSPLTLPLHRHNLTPAAWSIFVKFGNREDFWSFSNKKIPFKEICRNIVSTRLLAYYVFRFSGGTILILKPISQKLTFFINIFFRTTYDSLNEAKIIFCIISHS